MSGVLLREAQKDYVCSCCGHLIKKGEKYLDKIQTLEGHLVRHTRYHDECPFSSVVALAKVLENNQELVVSLKDEKWRVKGIQFFPELGVILYNWDNSAQTELTLEFFLDHCFTAQGLPIRSLLCI